LSEAAKVPAVHDLALVLSGRFDDYSDFGHAFNPEYALIWRPTSALTVRTSLAQSFRPPPLFDLHMPLVERQGPIADPARNNELSFLTFRGGGNPDLKPSNADSLSLGLRFEPKVPFALRLGANFWRISIDETITIPSPARLLAAESLFPERVVRGPPSAADIAAGIPGPLQTIDVTRLNDGAIRTSGVDLSASATLDTRVGRFKPELSATWVHDFTTSDLISGPGVDRVGVANTQGTVPRWRGVGTLSWNLGGVGFFTAVRYVPSFDDVDLIGARNGRRIDSQTVVDVQLSLDLGDLVGEQSPWNGFELRAGACNLFDAEPPFAEVAGPVGFDPTQGDLRQRFAYLKLAKKF
jgi:iron complex outermembrane receptor protein